MSAPNTWHRPHELNGLCFFPNLRFEGDFEKRWRTRRGHVMTNEWCGDWFHTQDNLIQLDDPGRRSCAFDKNLGTVLSCMWYLAKNNAVCVIQNTFMQKNTTEPWHTHLGNTIFGITKAADLFFGILIVVSALLLGQELSNECQKNRRINCSVHFPCLRLRSWHWTEPPTDQYIQRCALLDSAANSAWTKCSAWNRLFFVCRNFALWIFHNFHEQMYNPGALFAMTQVWLWIIHMIGLGPWMSCHRRFGFLVMFVVELIMRDGPLDFRHIWFAGHFNNAQCSFYQTLFSVPKSEPLCIHNIKWE